MSKLKTTLITIGVLAILTFTIQPVTNWIGVKYRENRADDLSTKVSNVFTSKVNIAENYKVEKFDLTGTDIVRTSGDYGVKFNGVAKLSNGDNAFASLNYNVSSLEFLDLSKNATTKEIYNLLDRIVNEYEPASYSITPVTNLVNINDAFVKNTPTPFAGYNITDAMVYGLGAPVFNDEEKTITFDVKMLIDLDKTSKKEGWGISKGFDSTICFGNGAPISEKKADGTFTTIDKYIIKVDEKTYAAMKANPKAIYDACAETINGKQNLNLKANRKYTSEVAYNATQLLNIVDVKSAEADLSR